MPRGRPKSTESLDDKITRYSKVEGDHILWIGGTDKWGYGKTRVDGKHEGVHRLVWKIRNGEIPVGMVVMHTCDIRNCINPSHLILGTYADNTKDMILKGRSNYDQKRLTENEVRETRNSQDSTYSLAKKYGVAESTILKARRRETYKYLI